MTRVRKATQRRHSAFVANKLLEALQPLEHLGPAELEAAKQEFARREAEQASASEVVKLIRRDGVLKALLGYRHEDVGALLDAERLAHRELQRPADFVSGGAFSAAQKENASGSHRAEGYDYSHEEIRAAARRLGYFELAPHDRRRRRIRAQIVAALRLDEGNRSTSPESRDRHLRRILDAV